MAKQYRNKVIKPSVYYKQWEKLKSQENQLQKRQSKLVKAPSVTDSPVNLECKLLKTTKSKSNTKKHGTLVIGEVIGIYINNKFINKGRVDSTAMRYIARMGYSEYTTVSSRFRMKRPQWSKN